MAVTDIASRTVSGRSRVSALVDGSEVWFETSDAVLVPSGEAFGTAFLIPAMHAGRRLAIDAPTDGEWLSNVSDLVDIVAQWWDLPSYTPTAPRIERSQCADGVGLFFTGGVDSFFSLLEAGIDIDTIVNVQGFDIPLADSARLSSAERDVRMVAEALGIRCVVVRTNLRSHLAHQPVSWERTHGGALLSIGHLLRGALSEIVLSSSAHRSATRTWGTDWRIDRFWSSGELAVTHAGEDWWRHQKLEQIAHHPLVRDHLRVCWEHRSQEPNCCECDKCLRTMITLGEMDALEDSTRFDNGPIAERIERLAVAPGPGNRLEYMLMIESIQDEHIARALSDLLARGPTPSPVDSQHGRSNARI